jgi:TetR/AcrR family transcriptional repressor of nem operon
VETAAGLAYRGGFRSTGLQEILGTCEVPKGSFYFHFRNKEDLCREVVRVQCAGMTARIRDHFTGERPLSRELAAWFEGLAAFQSREVDFGGCPVGNLAQELSVVNDGARVELAKSFVESKAILARRFRQARVAGELPGALAPEKFAGFLLDLSQGALLLSKVERSVRPILEARDVVMALLGGDRGEQAPAVGRREARGER